MATIFELMGKRERNATPGPFKQILLDMARSVDNTTQMITALFVQTNGAYFGQEGIDPWDEVRDARLYTGDAPVIAHPPCARWCRLAGMVEKRWGYKKKGDDGGCFKSALESVRRCGGVLEHPAYSDAWKAFGMQRPDRKGGWTGPDEFGGYTCHVEQGQYGHRARKATWLYAVRCRLPELKWGPGPAPTAVVSACSWDNRKQACFRGSKARCSKAEASATPSEFKAILLEMASSVKKD